MTKYDKMCKEEKNSKKNKGEFWGLHHSIENAINSKVYKNFNIDFIEEILNIDNTTKIEPNIIILKQSEE